MSCPVNKNILWFDVPVSQKKVIRTFPDHSLLSHQVTGYPYSAMLNHMNKAFQVGAFFQQLLCFQANMEVLWFPLFHGRLIIIDSRWRGDFAPWPHCNWVMVVFFPNFLATYSAHLPNSASGLALESPCSKCSHYKLLEHKILPNISKPLEWNNFFKYQYDLKIYTVTVSKPWEKILWYLATPTSYTALLPISTQQFLTITLISHSIWCQKQQSMERFKFFITQH